MLNTVNGVPGHVLLVHAVVVFIPLAAILAIASAVWPLARARIGILGPLVALVALVFVPLATNAGEWLQERVPETALVSKHVEMGDGLTVWATMLFLLTSCSWLLPVVIARSPRVPALASNRWIQPVLRVAICAVAIVAVVQTIRIGDSGAKAAWDGRLSNQTSTGGG